MSQRTNNLARCLFMHGPFQAVAAIAALRPGLCTLPAAVHAALGSRGRSLARLRDRPPLPRLLPLLPGVWTRHRVPAERRACRGARLRGRRSHLRPGLLAVLARQLRWSVCAETWALGGAFVRELAASLRQALQPLNVFQRLRAALRPDSRAVRVSRDRLPKQVLLPQLQFHVLSLRPLPCGWPS